MTPELPPELWLHISSFLSKGDLVKLMLLNRMFLLRSLDELYERLYLPIALPEWNDFDWPWASRQNWLHSTLAIISCWRRIKLHANRITGIDLVLSKDAPYKTTHVQKSLYATEVVRTKSRFQRLQARFGKNPAMDLAELPNINTLSYELDRITPPRPDEVCVYVPLVWSRFSCSLVELTLSFRCPCLLVNVIPTSNIMSPLPLLEVMNFRFNLASRGGPHPIEANSFEVQRDRRAIRDISRLFRNNSLRKLSISGSLLTLPFIPLLFPKHSWKHRFPHLEAFKLQFALNWQAEDIFGWDDLAYLPQFLEVHRQTLRHVTLVPVRPDGTMPPALLGAPLLEYLHLGFLKTSKSYDDFLGILGSYTDTVKHSIAPNLKTLQLTSSLDEDGQIYELRPMDMFTMPWSSMSTKLGGYLVSACRLQRLSFITGGLNLPIIVQLAGHLPQLQTLMLKYESGNLIDSKGERVTLKLFAKDINSKLKQATSRSILRSWDLRDLTLWSNAHATEIENKSDYLIMRLLAKHIPTLTSFCGRGHMDMKL